MGKFLAKTFIFTALLFSSVAADSSWIRPEISDLNKLGHIFRDARGHFSIDTPENRAFIELATSSPENRVATNAFGVDIYLKTLPDGTQAWAEVRKGKIANGGRNHFPKQWVSDPSNNKGGDFITPKFCEYISDSETFKGHLVVNNLRKIYELVSQLPQSTNLELRKVQGVAGNYGRILNLLEDMEAFGKHTLHLNHSSLSEDDVIEVLRDVARGVFVHEDLPFFSLHFNRSLTSYPVIPPAYRNTLTGEALGMLDYFMKGFANGTFYEEEFVHEWGKDRKKSREYLSERAVDYHEYCESLGIRYRTFNEILEEIMGGTSPKGSYKDPFTISYQLVFNQQAIYKAREHLSFEGGFNITGKIEGTPLDEDEEKHYGYLAEACSQMCEQMIEVLPRLPICKKYFEILHLANFFSYYCNSLRDAEKIPLLDRTLPAENSGSCPQVFPPLPVSLDRELLLPLMPFFNSLEDSPRVNVVSFLEASPATDEMIGNAYDAVFEGVQSFVQERSNQWITTDQCSDLTFEILQFCKQRYQTLSKSVLEVLKRSEHTSAVKSGEQREKFLRYLDQCITEAEGRQKRELLKIKIGVTKWFNNPLLTCFEDSGFLFSLLDGSVKYVGHCSDGQMHIGGGCGITVVDMEAEYSPNLEASKEGLLIQLSYGNIELEEVDNLVAATRGYLYPPLSKYPYDNDILNLLHAIATENMEQFRLCCEKIQDWNFRDSMGISLVHYASRCKNGDFLEALLKRGAQLDVFDSQNLTPLHYAARYGSTACIQTLLDRCPKLLEKKGEDGQTALFSAVQHGSLDSLELLLTMGANPNCTIVNDLSALLWAIQSKHAPIAIKLIEHPDVDLDYAVKEGNTALEFAIQMEETKVLEKLIACGANVNRICRGYTPLHLATSMGYIDGAKELLHCDDISYKTKSSWGETPMEMAERLGQQEIVGLLVERMTRLDALDYLQIYGF